jgi:colicin import membrane protein
MYVVNVGFAFTSKRGMINEGEEITEKDFSSHEAFVKAISKSKIVIGETEEQKKAKDKAAAEKARQEAEAAEKAKRGGAITIAKQNKEAAAAAAKAAQETLANLEKELAEANAARADAEAKIAPACEILKAKENGNQEITVLRKSLSEAESELEKAKPKDKAAAEKKANEAKINLAQKLDADPEYKSAFENCAALQAELDKAVADKTEIEAKILSAKEMVALAESELDKAAAELSALEVK